MFSLSEISLKKIQLTLLFLISFFIILYPSNNNSIFDGFVLDKKFEVFFVCFFIPLVFLFKIKITKVLKIILVFLSIIKGVIIILPNSGILYNQFIINDLDKKEVTNVDFIFKQKNEKFILNNSLYNKSEFPIEWINYIHPYTFEIGPNCHFEEVKCNKLVQRIENYKIQFEFNSSVYLNKDSKIYFEGLGVKDYELKLMNNESSFDLLIEMKDKINKKILQNIPTGNYKLSGFIIFQGSDFKLVPKLITDNITYDGFKKNIFFQANISSFQFNLLFILINVFNILFILSVFIISINLLFKIINELEFKYYKHNYFLSLLFIAIIISLSFFYNYENMFNNIFENDSLIKIFSGTFLLALYIFVQLIFLFIYSYKGKINNLDSRQITIFYLTFIVLISLIYIFVFNYENLNKYKLHSQGDDWWVFEYYSYRILTLSEYLRAGEDTFYFRPLSRYVSAFNHLFFGQSFFLNIIIDIWSILMTGYFFILILNNYKINKHLVLISTFILIFLYFGETFKVLIGRGMPEYLSSILLIGGTYYLIKYNYNIKILNLIFISIFLILGIWLREDHIFVSLSLILLTLNLTNETNLIKLIIAIIKKHKLIVIFYTSLIAFGFSLLFIRNYIVSGKFFGSNIHPNFGSSNYESIISIYRIITGSPLENFPRLFTIINLLALIMSLIYIFSKNINNEILRFAIIIISIVSPYIFLVNWGYFPRYSIHLLPFTSIFICLLIHYKKLPFSKNLLNKFSLNEKL